MPFFISTPIYYVNAKPHLGHAYTTIVADCLARFHKAMGEETFFLTGTDEHGDKIDQAAQQHNQSPQEYADSISALFRNLWPHLGIDYSDYIRTTEPRHKACVQKVLQKVYDTGDIYFGSYGGHYCYGCERFYTEKELEGGLCPQHRTKPEYIEEQNYFFKMSRHQQWLLDYIKANPTFIRPERYRNEVVSLLESGALDDLCISRPKSRLSWGIELPFDSNFVCYVWFDALLNYITALEWPDGDKFKKFWPVAQHLVAKDILKPHAVFWPTMLRAAGLEPYTHLNVHGYWLVKDTKMSKSLGNVVEPLELAERYGVDPFRYFLMREMQFGNDASFSEPALVGRLNADLANDLGNLFSRTLSMTHKYFQGIVPEPGEPGELEDALQKLAAESIRNYQSLFENVMFARGLESLWEFVRAMNKYIDETAPWALFKQQDTVRLGTVMYTLLEGMRKVAALLWPVIPESSKKMLAQLGQNSDEIAVFVDEADTWGKLKPGTSVSKASNLFPRVELSQEQPQEASETKEAAKKDKKSCSKAEKDAGTCVDFEDFQKLDLRLGTIISVELHPKADRLFRVLIDLGEPAPRQVIAGLAEFFQPDDLVGRQVVVVANLKPRKLRGLESQGMILAVRDGDTMQLLAPSAAVTNGSKVS